MDLRFCTSETSFNVVVDILLNLPVFVGLCFSDLAGKLLLILNDHSISLRQNTPFVICKLSTTIHSNFCSLYKEILGFIYALTRYKRSPFQRNHLPTAEKPIHLLHVLLHLFLFPGDHERSFLISLLMVRTI